MFRVEGLQFRGSLLVRDNCDLARVVVVVVFIICLLVQFFDCLGGCQNYGPFLGTLNIRCRTILGTQKGTIILTTTHLGTGNLEP